MTASSAVKPPSEFSFTWIHTKVIPESAAAENCLLAFGATLSQSPSARATFSPSITALPLPEITPYISSLLLCEWTNGTPAPPSVCSSFIASKTSPQAEPRHTGDSVGAADNCTAQMEEEHAAEHRRHGALYAARADGVQIIRCATDIFEDRLCRIHQIPRPPLQGGSFAYPHRRTRTRRKSRPGGLLPCGTE